MDGDDRDRGGVDRVPVPLMSNFTKLCLFVRLVYFILFLSMHSFSHLRIFAYYF